MGASLQPDARRLSRRPGRPLCGRTSVRPRLPHLRRWRGIRSSPPPRSLNPRFVCGDVRGSDLRHMGLGPIPPPQGEVAAAEPPRTRRNGSLCRIMSETRAEPLTEGVKALRCGNCSGAAGLGGSWNRLTPSASLRSAPHPEVLHSDALLTRAAIRVRNPHVASRAGSSSLPRSGGDAAGRKSGRRGGPPESRRASLSCAGPQSPLRCAPAIRPDARASPTAWERRTSRCERRVSRQQRSRSEH